MTEQLGGPDGNQGVGPGVDAPMAERRAAHERLSTGALARWARACATHPWRVIGGWVGIVVVLIALVATVGGSLKEEFASEQGGVLNLVFAAPAGQRLDTPERKAAIKQAIARLKSPEFKPTKDK